MYTVSYVGIFIYGIFPSEDDYCGVFLYIFIDHRLSIVERNSNVISKLRKNYSHPQPSSRLILIQCILQNSQNVFLLDKFLHFHLICTSKKRILNVHVYDCICLS